MGLAERIKLLYGRDGLTGLLRKGWRKSRHFLFYSTSSTWYKYELDRTVLLTAPTLNLEVVCLERDKSELIDWLEKNRDSFPWIFSKKELNSALANKHLFFILKHEKKIIGYIKVGIGPTYILDFDRTVEFEPEVAFVYDTFILPEYRGMNLALYALRLVSSHFRQKGFKRILCHIEPWNLPSVKTYEKAGFHKAGTIRFVRIAICSFYILNRSRPFLSLEKLLEKKCSLP